MLTFRSIRGRLHGELNAANRFGEILVALKRSMSCRQVIIVTDDSPIALQDVMVEDDADTRKVQYASDDQRVEDVVPPVRPGLREGDLRPRDEDRFADVREQEREDGRGVCLDFKYSPRRLGGGGGDGREDLRACRSRTE